LVQARFCRIAVYSADNDEELATSLGSAVAGDDK
jgi:hypothetical protein